MTVRYGAVTIDWLGHATVRIEGQTGAVIYLDPGRYGVLENYDARDGDLVLVSHEHHYDPEGIQRVAHEDAIVVVHEAIGRTDDLGEHEDGEDRVRAPEPPEDLPYEVERVRADESFILGPLDLFTTPAHNEPDGPNVDADGSPIHPEGTGCGYAVTIDGVRVFWPGHTDALSDLEAFDVDVLLAPIGGDGTMDRREAAALADRLRPGLVCPVNYDTYDAIAVDEEAFVVDVATRGVPVVLEDGER